MLKYFWNFCTTLVNKYAMYLHALNIIYTHYIQHCSTFVFVKFLYRCLYYSKGWSQMAPESLICNPSFAPSKMSAECYTACYKLRHIQFYLCINSLDTHINISMKYTQIFLLDFIYKYKTTPNVLVRL